ncbi:MAG: sulfite exporter TauE/SafE family protein [Legionellaceae bacterium]|nr:sulfite exporter TauE/SafE family protein [Legionellaceae bacterium]
MASDRRDIKKRYATERHKRFFFPIRPLFTLGSSIFFAGLYLLGVMPIAIGIILTAAFAFEDLPLAPFIKFIRAANNLSNGRKKLKSAVMISVISLSALIGGPLAFFLFIHNPFFMLGMAAFVFGTGCSPIWLFLGGAVGALIADRNQKITPLAAILMGVGIGWTIGFLLPTTIIPPVVSAIFVSSVTCAFIGSVIAKQSLRFYFYCKYGHSNADGYNIDRTPQKQAAFMTAQAKKFDVSVEHFKALTEHCQTKVAHIKHEASFMHALKATRFSNPFALFTWCLDEFALKRNYQTNAYKDIYHGLMAKDATPETVKHVQALLKDSQKAPEKPENTPKYPFIFCGKRHSDLQARTFFHQTQLAETGGISEDLIGPFIAHTP